MSQIHSNPTSLSHQRGTNFPRIHHNIYSEICFAQHHQPLVRCAKKIWPKLSSTSPCLSNTLATQKNLSKWWITQSSACSFCLQSETLQHIVSSCKSYLEQGRYTWRHDSVLNFIANTLSGLQFCSLYASLPAFLSPSLITGDSHRPDLILVTNDNNSYILELTIRFESNIKFNSDRKAIKYNPLQKELRSKYQQIKFINLSLGALGTVGSSSESFIDLLNSLEFNKPL